MISGLLGAILPVANTVIDRLVPDKNLQAKVKAEMEKTLVQAEAAAAFAESNGITGNGSMFSSLGSF